MDKGSRSYKGFEQMIHEAICDHQWKEDYDEMIAELRGAISRLEDMRDEPDQTE